MNEGQPEPKLPQSSVAKGRYRLIRSVGQGGMGSVIEGVDTQSGRGVAIKLLRKEVATDPQIVQRFLLEAETLSKIQHPNIVQLIESGQEPDGSLYIVQELLSGADLRGRLEGQRMAVRDAFDIALPIMGALVAAHEKGVLHRDVKPENIFLTRGPKGETLPKLIDFGLSKFMGAQPQNLRLTRSGMPIGTPFYMSPEQARAEPDLNGQADVWSMATVIYEMIAGRCPFQESNLGLLMYKILSEPVPRIEEFAPQVPPDVAALLHTALESDRARRFPSMRHFLFAVTRCESLAAGPGEIDLATRHKSSLPEVKKNIDALAKTMISGIEPPTAGANWNPSATAPFLLTPGGQAMKREIDKALDAVRRRAGEAETDPGARDSVPGMPTRESFASTLAGGKDVPSPPRSAFNSTARGPGDTGRPSMPNPKPSGFASTLPEAGGSRSIAATRVSADNDSLVLGDSPAPRDDSYSLGPAVTESRPSEADMAPVVPNHFPWLPVLILTVLVSGGITFAVMRWRARGTDAPVAQATAVVDAAVANSVVDASAAALGNASDAASALDGRATALVPAAPAAVDAGVAVHTNPPVVNRDQHRVRRPGPPAGGINPVNPDMQRRLDAIRAREAPPE